MNATMIKGERSKLLAVAVVIAMVACALVAFMPSADAQETEDATVYEVSATPAEGQYADIPTAIAAAEAVGETTFTVKLVSDVTGDGIRTDAGQNVTIDLGGFTYTIDYCVGSNGSQSNGMQLLQDSTVTILNGTVAVTENAMAQYKSNGDEFGPYGAGILVQNYSDLTLDGVVLDGRNLQGNAYVLSNNCGDSVITGETKIIASEGDVAFDVYGGFQNYSSVSVTIDEDFTGEITGPIEIDEQKTGYSHKLSIEAQDVELDTIALKNGSIELNGGSIKNATIDITGTGKLVANNGSIIDSTLNLPGYAAVVTEQGLKGTVNFDGCTFNAAEGGSVAGVYIGMFSGMDADVNITDCKFVGTFTEGAVDFNAQAGSDVKVTVSGEKPVSVHAWAANGDADVEVGKNLDLSGATNVTELKMSGSSGNQPTIVVPEGQTLEVDKITGTGFVEVDENGTLICPDNQVPEIDGEIAYVDSESELRAAIGNSSVKEIHIMGDITTTGGLNTGGKSIHLIDGDLTVEHLNAYDAGKNAVVVSKDRTFTFSGQVKITLDGLSTVAGSKIVYDGTAAGFYNTNSPDVQNSESGTLFTPEFTDGTFVKIAKSTLTYTIYHFPIAEIGSDVQYGVAISDLTYRGTAYTDSDIFFYVEPFEEGWDADYDFEVFMTSDSFKLVTGKDPADPWKSLTDARTYDDAIRAYIQFSSPQYSGPGTYIYFDLVIDPAESELVFGEYNKDTIYGADVDKIIDSTVDFTVTQTGTDVTFTGNLLYYDGTWADGTWPADEQKGYYILFSVDWMDGITFDPAKVVLSYGDKTYNATTFDNCMLFYLGENPTITAGMKINIDYDGEGKNFSDTTYDIDFSGVSLRSHIDIGIYGDDESENDNVYDVPVEYLTSIGKIAQSGEEADVEAYVYYYKGDWADDTWPADKDEGYYLVISVTNPTGSWENATVMVDGEELSTKPFDGYLVKFLGTTEANFPKNFTISADIDGDGDRYTPGEKVITLDLTTSVNIIIGIIDQEDVSSGKYSLGTIDDEAVEIGDLQGDDTAVESKETAENTYTLYFTGTLNWMHGYTWYNSADADEQRGYYIGFTVDLPQGWNGATVTTYLPNGTDAKKTFDGNFDGYFVWKVDSDAQADKFTVEIDGTTYTYILDFSGLEFVAAGGYYDNDQPAGQGIEENLLGFVKGDVVGETMYMAFSNKKAGIVEFELTFNGEPVYTETTSAAMPVGPHLWYFSFIDQVLKYNGDDYVPVPGLYTMTASIGGVQIAEATAYYPGTLGFDYNADYEDVYTALEDLGYDTSDMIVGTPTGIAPETMWILWYNYQLEGDVTATLTWTDGIEDPIEIFTETVEAWKSADMHIWYFTFDKDNENWIGLDSKNKLWPDDWTVENGYDGIMPGIYTMTVTCNGKEVAYGQKEIVDESIFHVTINEDGEDYDIEFNAHAGMLYTLPESNIDGKTIDHWELWNNGVMVRTYNAGGQVHFGYIPGIVGQDLEFKAKYASGTGTGGEEPSQRDTYSVEATIEGTTLTMTASSAQVDNFINPVGGVFYYRITVQSGDNVYTLNVMSQRIYSGSASSTDTRTIDLLESIDGLTSLNGARVSVQFLYDYGPIHYGSNIIEFGQISTVEIVNSGLGETAENTSAAIEQIYTENGIDKKVPTDIAPETVFAVFEADAGSYVMTMQSMVDGTIVYQETLSFTDGGYHLWYFSLAEGQPSWNPETENVDVALVEGAVVEGNSYGLFIDGVHIGTIVA